MADRVLRDQCKHDRYEAHYLTTPEDAADGPTDTFDGNPCPGGQKVVVSEVVVVFDGPPGPDPGRFVEVENPETGESIKLGKWFEIDGLWYLAFDAALGEPTTAVKEIIDEDQELLDRLAET